MDFRRQTRFVEGIKRFFVSQDVAPTSLGLQLVELFKQAFVGRQALGP